MKLLVILCILSIVACGGEDDLSMQKSSLSAAEEHSLSISPFQEPQQIWHKGCWVDDDCNDGIDCTGREWCCDQDKFQQGICDIPGECYPGLSPCGQPISAILPICDLEWDECRGCYTDEECNIDTKYTTVNWSWCGGPRRCGREGEGPGGRYFGVCLGTGEGFPCEWYEICNEEEQRCEDPPECRNDSDCPGLEGWCDGNGKCHLY